jgi:hypothetical protein
MGTRWERLAGDTSHFAIKLSFADDLDGQSFVTPEEAGSWGTLQVWVHGRNLCAHSVGDETLESVHWYLLPIIEWFVLNWDALFHEERLPNRNAADTAHTALSATRDAPASLSEEQAVDWEQRWHDWWRRHNIEAARNGGPLPSICLRRWGQKVEVSWATPQHARSLGPATFIHDSGSFRPSAERVADAVFEVLSDAIEHLASRDASARISLLRAAVSQLTRPQRSANGAVARPGHIDRGDGTIGRRCGATGHQVWQRRFGNAPRGEPGLIGSKGTGSRSDVWCRVARTIGT